MPQLPSDSSTSEILSGTIERVTFHSEDSGFSVLRVKAKGLREPQTVIGRVAAPNPGEHLVATGEWAMDRVHGRQFKASDIRTTEPDSIAGITAFLGSGLVKGIGPVYAEKLVAHFGREVLDVIDQRSKLLEQVEGIGPTRRKRIRESWLETRSLREIMTFLMSHGVSTARAFRIQKAYGEEAMVRVQADPYCLARDIRGIGFQTADQIASHFGIGKDSPLRARAGIEHVLQEATGQGHVAVPRDELVRSAEERLEIGYEILEDAVLHGLAEKRLILETQFGETPLIYLRKLHYAETSIAADLHQLAAQAPPCPEIQVDKALDWVQKHIHLDLAPAQQEAVRTALCSKIMVITGGPGVGKTTIVRAIIEIFKARKLKVKLAAPTGRAAKRLSETSGATALTLHRLLVYDPQNGGFQHNREKPLKGDVFIIDEASMLDINLASQLIQAIPKNAAVIFVGDVDQLPSVGPGSVLRDLIDSGTVPVARLTEIFRQAESSAIITNAHRINLGDMPISGSPEQPSDFYMVPAGEAETVLARMQSLMGGLLKKKFGMDPLREAQILTPMQRGVLGAQNLNRVLQEQLNPTGDSVERFGVCFRVRDRVMQVQNNYDKDVYNGDMGTIVAVDREEQELHVAFGGRTVTYNFNELDELNLSYAITIHKSQGSEFPCVILPVHTQHFIMLQRNLLYTGVTRGKKLVLLVGTEKAAAMALNNTDSRGRISCLRQRLQA